MFRPIRPPCDAAVADVLASFERQVATLIARRRETSGGATDDHRSTSELARLVLG